LGGVRGRLNHEEKVIGKAHPRGFPNAEKKMGRMWEKVREPIEIERKGFLRSLIYLSQFLVPEELYRKGNSMQKGNWGNWEKNGE